MTIDFENLSPRDLKKLAISLNSNYELGIVQFITQWFDESADISVFTSGSTGKPKEIKLTKKAMQLSAERSLSFFSLQKGETALLTLPLQYIAGKMMLLRALVGKMKLIALEPHLKIVLPKQKIHFAAFIPLQMDNLIQQNTDFSLFENIIIGGARISQQLEEKIKILPAKIYATYGMTETITHIAMQRLNGVKPQNYFQCLPDVQIWKDRRDCLRLLTPYSKQEIKTNDRVEILAKDKFRYLGRIDNVINSGGLKIQSEAVENLLSVKIKTPFFVAGIPDEKLGEKLVLFIEGQKNSKQENEIIDYMQNKLARNKTPKKIFWLSKFVYTHTLKINRKDSINKFTDNN